MRFLGSLDQNAKEMPALWVDLDIVVIMVPCMILIGVLVWIVLKKMGE
jgi:CHASE3 domain sensor protein